MPVSKRSPRNLARKKLIHAGKPEGKYRRSTAWETNKSKKAHSEKINKEAIKKRREQKEKRERFESRGVL